MKYSSKVVRKLILGITALSLTTVCLVSTTFAWFAKNANAWTEDFTIDLSINEGLQISVDGINYYDSIDKEQLKHAIALKKYNLINEDNQKEYKDLTEDEINEYSKITLTPVSPDENYNFYGFYTSEGMFKKVNGEIKSVTDISAFLNTNINANKEFEPVNLTEMKKIDSYVVFDLYFKPIASTNDPKDAYYLQFSKIADESDETLYKDETYIKSTESTVKLSNSLSTKTKEYVSGESITINPENAARIATVQYNDDNTINNDYNYIFEPNLGYSSSAYLNGEDDNDPDINPMVTYFNNSHNLGDLYLKDIENKLETQDTFYGNNLGVFRKNLEDGTYNNLKLTLYLWLDGYDGDYIEGVDTDKMHFFLSFTKVGVNE